MEQMRQNLANLVELVSNRYGTHHVRTYGMEVGEHAAHRALRFLAHMMGAKLLGVGEFRAAFLVGDKVLKVAYNADGADANAREYRVWREASNGIRPHLVPVLDIDIPNGVITMEYAAEKPAKHLGWDKFRHVVEETKYAIEAELQELLGNGIRIDLHAGNITCDHMVFDYGGVRDSA